MSEPREMTASTVPAAAAAPKPAPAPAPHTHVDDLQALLTGTLFAALGIVLFRQAGFVTGGSVGLAFLAHYALSLPFGVALFLINVPFYLLAWRRMGKRFTLKTLAAVSLVSVEVEAIPHWLGIQQLHPLFAALAGGALIGAGLLILFRHRASLGGLNVLVLWLQERFGWRAGYVQLAMDLGILAAAAPWVDWRHLALSVLGAVAMNLCLAINHRPGRYVAF